MKKTILVVDDNADIIDVVQTILEMKGFDVVTHSTGFGVPEVVEQYKPDLILLDYNLPGKNGAQICKELKAINEHQPIILFSAHFTEKEAMDICKVDAFISKPFEVKNLISTITAYIA